MADNQQLPTRNPLHNDPTRSWRLAVYLLVALLIGGIGFFLGSRPNPVINPLQAAQTLPPAVQALETTFTNVAEEVRPSVVHIRVESLVAPSPQDDLFGPLRPFMPDTPRRPVPREGTGSGVIIDSAGYILTNVHVVADARSITVITANRDEYRGEVVGTDPDTDLAIVKITPKADRPLVAARLGDADRAKVGSFVMAIGSPFGLDETVTSGVISGTGRSLPRTDEGSNDRFRNLLQTDAAINPGNSGGPLVNLMGEVIGINQAIFSPGPIAGNIGIGFAIPINSYNKELIASLRRGQPIVRGRLGAYVGDISSGLAEVYGVSRGAFVQEVVPDTPAAQAGLQAEDVIITYNGKPVENSDQLVDAVQRTRPGTEVPLRIMRGKQEKTLTVRIGEKKAEVAQAQPTGEDEGKPARLGLRVSDITPQIAASLKLKAGIQGVVVKAVDPTGDAARAGIQAGMIIVKVNLTPVRNVEEYKQATATLKVGRPATLRYYDPRQDRSLTVVIDEVTE